jgi:hypothetical protein
MARWKLLEAHYLRVEGTKWEYSEVDRITGRPKRTQFDVPLLINPNDEGDLKSYGQNDPDGNLALIVGHGTKGPHGRDILWFEKDGSPGRPTPNMIPLDDEAKEISEKSERGWKDPGSQGAPTYAENMIDGFIAKMSELQVSAQAAPKNDGITEVLATMTAMMAKQTEILAQLAAPQAKRKVA